MHTNVCTENLVYNTDIHDRIILNFKFTCTVRKNTAWVLGTKDQVKLYFGTFIIAYKEPGKAECEKFLEINDITDLTWKDLKYLVYNILNK